jgi:hypothetical protein
LRINSCGWQQAYFRLKCGLIKFDVCGEVYGFALQRALFSLAEENFGIRDFAAIHSHPCGIGEGFAFLSASVERIATAVLHGSFILLRECGLEACAMKDHRIHLSAHRVIAQFLDVPVVSKLEINLRFEN